MVSLVITDKTCGRRDFDVSWLARFVIEGDNVNGGRDLSSRVRFAMAGETFNSIKTTNQRFPSCRVNVTFSTFLPTFLALF